MNTPLLSAVLMLGLAAPAIALDAAPYDLQAYGHFKRMNHMKNTDGVVDIDPATYPAGTYGVGAPAHGTGEITILDGDLWIDYGVDGLGNAAHAPQPDEQAVLLVTARVAAWRDVILPRDMTADEMHSFIVEQANQAGIDTTKAFPFLLEGPFSNLDWHILNGLRAGGGHGNGGLFHKIKEHRGQTEGTVVGFYSAALQGVFTHPGESWHLHVVFDDEGKTGHVDAISPGKGTILSLPVSTE
jgi:hypothetical protein